MKLFLKKVLIISPTPTHPANAGNRLHILGISTFLKSNDFDVHFLYLAYEDFDINQSKAFWGSKFYVIPREKLFQRGPLVKFYTDRIREKVIKVCRAIQNLLGFIDIEQFRYNAELDSYFPRGVKEDISELQNMHHFDIVVCEYARVSKAFTYFDDEVVKVLDTHDKFTDRYNLYLQSGLTPEWVSLQASQEKKALQRADLVIALTNSEREYFQNIGKRKTIRYFSIPTLEPLPPKKFEKKLLYFASGNAVNVRTLHSFEVEVFPKIIEEDKDVQLIVGGSICKEYIPKHANISLAGQFVEARDFYKLGDVVINPEVNGTGFKIKTLEAICFGIPVVCTPAGAAGLADFENDHLYIADAGYPFASAVVEICRNDALRKRLLLKSSAWLRDKKVRMEEMLLEQINQLVISKA